MGFWVTALQNAYNGRGKAGETTNSILFVNLENSKNNRVINSGDLVNLDNCWVPWCFEEKYFPSHHIQIIDQDNDKVLWYIWQQENKASAGLTTMVCASTKGFEQPGPPIGGDSTVGYSYNIVIGPGDEELRTTNRS
jgi:hypothetical protein